MRFHRKSLLEGLRDQSVSTSVNLKLRKYFESSDLALVFQELYMSYLRAEVNDEFDETEHFLFPIEVNAELLCLSIKGLNKTLSSFNSDTHRLILSRKKKRDGVWIKINWRKFKRVIFTDTSNTFEEISKRHKIKKQEQLEEIEASPDVDDVYEAWINSKANISKPKKITDEIRMLIAKSLDKYPLEDIKEAIENLEAATTHNEIKSWYTKKWMIKPFLTQENGIQNWIGEAWEASAMNPENRPKNNNVLEADESDFVHDAEQFDIIGAFDNMCDFVEESNDRDINSKTFNSIIDFFNTYENASKTVIKSIDMQEGPFDEDKYGNEAITESNDAIDCCLGPVALCKYYSNYLKEQVLDKFRKSNKIPLNAADFDWYEHWNKFSKYLTRTDIGSRGMVYINSSMKDQINKLRRSDE